MKLSPIKSAELAREIACNTIFSRIGYDVEDQLATTPDGDDVWVSVRVLVKRDDIEGIAKEQSRARRSPRGRSPAPPRRRSR
jgi:hypothetical protein